MKKFVLAFTFLAIISCKEDVKVPEYVIISGSIQNNVDELAKIKGFELEAEIPISENGSFLDTLDIAKNGYYSLYIGRERATIYLEKGKNLSVVLNVNEFDETIAFTGDVAAENNYLAAKYLLSETEKSFQEVFAMEEDVFIKEANSINDMYGKLLVSTDGLSEDFTTMESKELEFTHLMNLENYQEYNRYYADNPNFIVSESYYDILKNVDFADTTTYRNSNAYKNLLRAHYSRLADEEEGKKSEAEFNSTMAYLSLVNKSLPNGYAKDDLMYNSLRYGLSADLFLDSIYALYKSSNSNAANLQDITERYNLLKPLLPGNPSPGFEFENHKGGTTNLTALNGNYVYVDVWATWCAPCIREIPSLKSVEHDYKNKKIVFVSISIDEKKDYDKWKEMVTSKQLGGVQLMADADWKSKFVTDYDIQGIPRFIIIDPQGNIVLADAPRPSDPKLRRLLDKLI